MSTSLVLRVCRSDYTSYNGFVWPSEVGAEVVAPDWKQNNECGHGLHGTKSTGLWRHEMLEIETSFYNEKRYGRPWIAKVDFASRNGHFRFGNWVGQDGCLGLLTLDACPGDVVARGQKDFRNPKNSAPDFYIVQGDLSLTPVSKVDAYKHWQANVKMSNVEEVNSPSFITLTALQTIAYGIGGRAPSTLEEAVEIAREALGRLK